MSLGNMTIAALHKDNELEQLASNFQNYNSRILEKLQSLYQALYIKRKQENLRFLKT